VDAKKNRYVYVLTVFLMLQATLFYLADHGDSRPLSKPLKDFPEVFSGWQMIAGAALEPGTQEALKADDILERFYVSSSVPGAGLLRGDQRDAVMASAEELFIAYFSSQQQGQSPHSPKNCLPGAGWAQVENGEISLSIPGFATPITINKYVVSKSESESLVLYWYQSHGRVVASEFGAKVNLVMDSLRYHRSDTALVRVVVPVIHNDLAGALDRGTSFVKDVFPEVYRYLPM